MSTISTPVNHGIVLGPPNYISPVTITSSGSVSNTAGTYAITGATGTVVNNGVVVETGGSFFSDIGIYLGSGSVSNSGAIVSDGNGVEIRSGVAGITNSGTITATNWGIRTDGGASITNTGTIFGASNGIHLIGGGSITNSGVISGSDGIGISGGAGTSISARSPGPTAPAYSWARAGASPTARPGSFPLAAALTPRSASTAARGGWSITARSPAMSGSRSAPPARATRSSTAARSSAAAAMRLSLAPATTS